MQLSPGERSILAYFPDSAAAQDAVQALKDAGVSEVQLDRVSRYGTTNNSHYNNPIAGEATTQTGLVLYSGDADTINDDSTRILLGADPSVEGYVPPGYGTAGGKAFLVTVVTGDDKVDEASAILKEKGAYF